MQEIRRQVESLVKGPRLPVLIEGEIGTGKETLARQLHRQSGCGGEFIRIPCRVPHGFPLLGPGGQAAALTPSETAGEDTIFLKNVHFLSRSLQQQLLAGLQSGWFPADLGGGWNPGRHLVSSTTCTLDEMIARGQFLPDLYFRLSACRIILPPLRERAEDIPELVSSMLVQASALDGGATCEPSSSTLDVMIRYSWPGNLRELENFVRNYRLAPDPEQLVVELKRRSEATRSQDGKGRLSLREQVRRVSRQMESQIILKALEHHQWNRRRAAQALQISYRSLLYKMKTCELRTKTARQQDNGS